MPFPFPPANPAAVPDVSAAVHENVVPAVVPEKVIPVVSPEQKVCDTGVALAPGMGFTVTAT